MHTLYDFLFSGNGWKVRRTLRLLRIPHRWVEVDLLAGETRSPAFLAMNPAGEIPVLELPDGTRLSESGAILLYLAEGTRWLPADRPARAEVMRWMFFEQSRMVKTIGRARFRRHHPGLVPTTDEELAGWDRAGHAALRVLEGHLADRRWVAAGRPTIADIAVAGYAQVAEHGGFSLAACPAIRRWLGEVAALPEHIDIATRPPSTWMPPAAAERWESSYSGDTLPWDTGTVASELIAFVEGGPPVRRALEIGCGTGTNAAWLAGQGVAVTAVDIAPSAIARARARCEGLEVELRVADVLAGSLVGPGSVDLVFDRGVFHTFDDPEQRAAFVRRVAEALAPDGCWLSLIGNADDANTEGRGMPRRTAADIVAAVEPALAVQSLHAVVAESGTGGPGRFWQLVARPRR